MPRNECFARRAKSRAYAHPPMFRIVIIDGEILRTKMFVYEQTRERKRKMHAKSYGAQRAEGYARQSKNDERKTSVCLCHWVHEWIVYVVWIIIFIWDINAQKES